MDRGAWWAIVRGVAKVLGTTERLNYSKPSKGTSGSKAVSLYTHPSAPFTYAVPTALNLFCKNAVNRIY